MQEYERVWQELDEKMDSIKALEEGAWCLHLMGWVVRLF